MALLSCNLNLCGPSSYMLGPGVLRVLEFGTRAERMREIFHHSQLYQVELCCCPVSEKQHRHKTQC